MRANESGLSCNVAPPQPPYRDAVAARLFDVPTRDGRARLELGPQFSKLQIDDRRTCTITDSFVTVVSRGRRRVRRQSFRTEGARIAIAQAYPGRDVAIWMETKRDVMSRLCGVCPPALLDDSAMVAWRKMDDMARRLLRAIEGVGCARLATEYGKGQHRVLLIDSGDRLEVFARPLFRERPRKVFELSADGRSVTTKRAREAVCSPMFDVTVTGDRLRLMDGAGEDVAALYLPWISREDRAEIARRFDALLKT